MEPEREADCEFCGYLIIWCLIVSLIFWASQAFGASYYMQDREGNMVILYDEPCPQPGWLSGWKKAALTYKGKDYEACWIGLGDNVMVFDSSGDVTPVPVRAFKKAAES